MNHLIYFFIIIFSFLHSNILLAAAAQNGARAEISLFVPTTQSEAPEFTDRMQRSFKGNGILNVKVNGVDFWHAYVHGIRAGREGMYFVPPHFAAWAIEQHNFKPLVRLATPLSYVIAAKRANHELFEINDLSGQTICSSKPLSLDYLLAKQAFKSSMRYAQIVNKPLIEKEMAKSESECLAFAVSNHVFKKVESKLPGRFIRLYQSVKYSNLVLIAHPNISATLSSKLTGFFKDDNNQDLLRPLITKYSEQGNLVTAQAADYPSEYWQQLVPYWGKAPR